MSPVYDSGLVVVEILPVIIRYSQQDLTNIFTDSTIVNEPVFFSYTENKVYLSCNFYITDNDNYRTHTLSQPLFRCIMINTAR